MSYEIEGEGADIPAETSVPAPTATPDRTHSSGSAIPPSTSTFEILVIKKLDLILRKQKELSNEAGLVVDVLLPYEVVVKNLVMLSFEASYRCTRA